MNYYSHHIGDYIKSTSYLTNEEDLAYRRMIELYYDTEKPLGLDVQLIAIRVKCDEFTVTKMLTEYFTKTKTGYRNKRCDLEIRQYHLKVKANRINGKLGGRPRKTQSVSITQVVSERLANDNPTETQNEPNLTLTKNQEPRTKNHKPVINPAVAADPTKREIWEIGKALLGNDSASLLGKLCKEYGQILVLQAVKDCAANSPAEPKAWLVARCQERRASSGNKSLAIERRNHEAVEIALREASGG